MVEATVKSSPLLGEQISKKAQMPILMTDDSDGGGKSAIYPSGYQGHPPNENSVGGGNLG